MRKGVRCDGFVLSVVCLIAIMQLFVMMRSIQPDSAVCFEMADLTDRDRLFD
jgi:hypothetical protein